MIKRSQAFGGFRRDLRYALHTLVAQPAFTAMALLALVVGVALNVAFFSAINGIWSRPWNVPEPERVVSAYALNPKITSGYFGFSLAGARFLNENSRTIEGAFASRVDTVRVAADAFEGAATASFVTGNFFEVLQVGMQQGRAFLAAEDDARAPSAVAVISDWLWTQRYGSDPAVVGTALRVDGIPFTVIGVAAQDFNGVTDEDRTDVWLPFASLQLVQPTTPSLFDDPLHCCSDLAARLRPGVSVAEAAAEWNALYGEWLRDRSLEPPEIVMAGTAMLDHPQRRREAAAPIAIGLTVLTAVLLLACANVTNLLLARAAARQAEIAVRMAIGAGRWRIVRQLLTEAAVLAAAAAAIALPLAYVLPSAALRFMGQTVPTNMSFAPDGNVLVYAIGLALLCTLAFGLAPALQTTRLDPITAIKGRGTSTRRSRLRGLSLGIQIAVSTALLVATGLLVRSMDFARTLDFGFRVDGISAVAVTLPPNVYEPQAEAEFFDAVVARTDSDEAVGISFLMPLGERHEFAGAGCTGEGINGFVRPHMVTPTYFDVLRIPLTDGRMFARGDAGRVVVNEAFARRCAPGRSLVGQSEEIGGAQHEIVGVVRDAQLHGSGGVDPIVFMPFQPGPVFRGEAVLLLPTPLAERAAAAVRELDSRATAGVVTMQEQVERWLGDTAGLARIAGAIGALALLLATVGVYGVLSYFVEQRRREIGVRIALGARPTQIVSLVMRQNAPALVGGLAAGLALAAGVSLVLRSELHGLSSADPVAYAAVLVVLLAAAVAACVLPARRALHTEPNVVLHCE